MMVVILLITSIDQSGQSLHVADWTTRRNYRHQHNNDAERTGPLYELRQITYGLMVGASVYSFVILQ